MKKLFTALCSIAVVSLLTSFLLAQNPEKVTRVIQLDVIDPDSPFFEDVPHSGPQDIPPDATLTIVSFSNIGHDGLRVDVHGLKAREWNQGSYALYIWPGGPNDYDPNNVSRSIFNGWWGPRSTKTLWLGLPNGFPVAVDTPTISAFIAHVSDDGSPFLGLPFADAIFAGTSVLP